jgi:sigma-B regulation protein RsbU (phosphoserine phosphatase)
MSPAAAASSSTRPVTVLLIDDQAMVGESVRRMLEPEKDIVFHFCKDPTKAIETANGVQPTVILQDLVMPDIDGLMLVKFFRANAATKQTPMIVLSSKEEPTVKAQAFALGANDYLVKLPDRIELIARIRYHSRSYIAQLERDEAYRKLAESERLMAEELAQASRYVQSLLPARLTGDVAINWRFIPSTQLGGDMFGYHWLDPDHLAAYLLDVSGHGVGSSLLAVSAANLLAAQSLAGVDFRDPGKVLIRLNDVFPMEKQNDKFFTIWYGVYSKPDRTLRFANAGHPPPLLFTGPNAADAPMQRLKSTGLAVGMMAGSEYDTRQVVLGPYARLLLYSDGVYEIARPDGSMWSAGDFAQYASTLSPADGPVLDRVLDHVKEMHGSEVLVDDFSILEVTYGCQ